MRDTVNNSVLSVVYQSAETSLKPLLDFFLSVFQHDEGSNCGNLGSNSGKGRYLMFPHASDGVRENNDKLSPCSIAHISEILQLKKDECFVGKNCTFQGKVNALCLMLIFFLWSVSDHPICGNHIVEEGEECDVGHNDEDLCCFSAKQPAGVQCRLKSGKVCRYPTSRQIHKFNPSSSSIPGAHLAYMILYISPSQGLCCGQDCGFKPAGRTCDEETDCQIASVCSGLSPYCPEPSAKENLTVCSLGTRVCLNGVSIHQPQCQILHN